MRHTFARVSLTIAKHAAPVGIVGGFLWATALGASIQTALIIGAGVGILLSLLLSAYAIAGIAGGSSVGEALAVTGMFVGLLIWLLIGGGVLAWVVRLIFF